MEAQAEVTPGPTLLRGRQWKFNSLVHLLGLVFNRSSTQLLFGCVRLLRLLSCDLGVFVYVYVNYPLGRVRDRSLVDRQQRLRVRQLPVWSDEFGRVNVFSQVPVGRLQSISRCDGILLSCLHWTCARSVRSELGVGV